MFEIDSASLNLLDAMEWVELGAYVKKLVELRLESGESFSAWAYFVKQPKEGLTPSKTYLEQMKINSRKRNFPQKYLDFIASHSSQESFELDHSFSLLFYGRKRLFAKQLYPLYRIHDELREKLCNLI